jgi:hypothetical protein
MLHLFLNLEIICMKLEKKIQLNIFPIGYKFDQKVYDFEIAKLSTY